MKVIDLYNYYRKDIGWAIYIYDLPGNRLLGYCNESHPWKSIHKAIQEMEVESFNSCINSLHIKVNFEVNEIGESEEECLGNGYEKIFSDDNKESLYAKENLSLNGYNGDADSLGYSYAITKPVNALKESLLWMKAYEEKYGISSRQFIEGRYDISNIEIPTDIQCLWEFYIECYLESGGSI